jgi:LmbE family N-acetylglucosaminyl deacetylase
MPLSWLSKRNHMAWNLDDAPFATRRREDEAAWRLLGAQYEHLGLLDAMYRRDGSSAPLYKRNITGVPIHPDDWRSFQPVVCQALQEATFAGANPPVLVFCPLTAGDHVDHVIIRHTIESMWPPQEIVYYEDYPYAERPSAIRGTLNVNGGEKGWVSRTVKLTEAEVEARIAAVACYASQLPGLFPTTLLRMMEIARARVPIIGEHLNGQPDPGASRSRMASALKAYIGRAGGERYWFRGAESAAQFEHILGGGTEWK